MVLARRWPRFGVALLLLTVAACSSVVPPKTRVYAPIDPELPRRLYVVSARERASVVDALQRAGFSIAADVSDAPLVLNVQIGGSRASKQCGSVRNVVYDLRQAGVRLAYIQGRGWTGTCQPNILTEMSAELARLFRGGA